jgi:hypothetical protein
MLKNLKIDNRFVLFLVMLLVFVLWLAFFATIIIYIIKNPEKLDTAMGLFTGLGLGAVTGFFTAMLTLSWQFYFRKKEEDRQVIASTVTNS